MFVMLIGVRKCGDCVMKNKKTPTRISQIRLSRSVGTYLCSGMAVLRALALDRFEQPFVRKVLRSFLYLPNDTAAVENEDPVTNVHELTEFVRHNSDRDSLPAE